MKLQIVEYKFDKIMLGCKVYRYMLELDGRAVAWTGSLPEKSSGDKVYDKLSRYIENNCTSCDINDYPRCNYIPGVESEVIFEKEVCGSYLKEMFVKTRIKDIDEDFKWNGKI